jgi:D-beta-D-heptose 7-phosphate kinase/D-beta-D-heptose 1-phosphate adenosyltransferase
MTMSTRKILARFPRRRILVAGDIMLDEYLWGAVRRISPEAPVPVVEVQRSSYVLGGAANTAANVRGLGGRPVVLSVLGHDQSGRRMRELLDSAGVACDGLVADGSRPTTSKTRIIAHHQQVVRVDQELRHPIGPDVEAALLARAEELMPGVDGCVLSDYAKGVVTPRFAAEFIRMAREAGKPVVVDPKGTDIGRYRGATVVKPNLHEVGQVLNCDVQGPDAVRAAGQQLLDRLGGSAVLITCGPQGMSLFERGRPPVHIPAEAREVFDVTGAGDTVAGTLSMALSAEAPLEPAARLASCAAGIVVGKVGTAAVQLAELASQWDAKRTGRAKRPSRRAPRLVATRKDCGIGVGTGADVCVGTGGRARRIARALTKCASLS